MPALVPRTDTLALVRTTLPYVRALAARGVPQALSEDPGLAGAVMTWDGAIVHEGLARDHRKPLVPIRAVLASSGIM
jgi:alanine dehydrogenase